MKKVFKILKVGNSKLITLPKELAIKVHIGDLVKFDLELLDILESDKNNITLYRCKKCDYHVDKDINDDNYCPACGEEGVLEIWGIKKWIMKIKN